MLQGPPLSEIDQFDLARFFRREREQPYWILSQVGGARSWMLATWRAEIPSAHPHIRCGTRSVEAVWRIWVILQPAKSNVLASRTGEQILLELMGPSLSLACSLALSLHKVSSVTK